MKPSDGRRVDHAMLGATLSRRKAYPPSGRERGWTCSLLTDSLEDCLRSHTERAERRLAALAFQRGKPAGESLQRLHDEHADQRTRLAILHELLTHPEQASEEQVATQAAFLVKDWREYPVEGRGAMLLSHRSNRGSARSNGAVSCA